MESSGLVLEKFVKFVTEHDVLSDDMKLFHHFQGEDKSVVVAAVRADSGRGGDGFGWRRNSGGCGRSDDGFGWRRSGDSGCGSDGFGWRKNHFGSA
ncbi:hypothetical protein DCAR_0728705 [Daucus carota subsp. sativus]|uniref:Uncharacterized protein n=1 Tax=Daucus carota subsp. sativus TaxID=79200 RepID=A0A161ZL34_DAUCS|nr:hypothetical protein DCAR_0728705 [Daucus carota subsp. sativus]